MLNTMKCDPGLAVAGLLTANRIPELGPVKARQQAAWASGNYGVIGNTLQIVGETLCEALDVRSGERLLDVASGTGNVALAAARRWCEVVAGDYVPALLETARRRVEADGLSIGLEVVDAENLPFGDGSFDLVASTFGAMFAPDHEKTAKEMLRVCRARGKIGLANWTPNGFIGELFKTIRKYVPPPAGMKSPALWGTASHIRELFGAESFDIKLDLKEFMFRYRSADHWIEIFRTYYGPVLKTFETLDAKARTALTADLKTLIVHFNIARDGTMVVPGEYLQTIIVKR